LRCFLLACLLAALSARAQGAPVPEGPSQSPTPLPEAAPPLVQAPTPEPGLPPLSEALPRSLRRGARLRVETQSGQSHSGRLVSLEPEALSLQVDAQQGVSLLLADVQRLETRERAVVPGLVTGGVIGAVSGGLFLGLLCTFAGEGDTDVLPCFAGGGLLGGAAGIGVGAVLGLGVPRWSRLYEKEKHGQLVLRLTEPEEDVLAHWFSGADTIGELGLQLGYARDMGTDQPTDGWGGRAHLLALIGPYLGLGPEVAWYGGVGTRIQSATSHTTVERHSLWQLGALVRVGSEVGPIRVSVLGGLGLSDNLSGHVGSSVGGEVEGLLGGRLPLALDVRYHFNLERGPAHSDPDYLTLGLGTRVRW
jgi:hypothetical protein